MTLNYLLYFCTPAKISIIFKYEHITPKKWMRLVKPKKALGQHFLKDLQIAERIADTLSDYKQLLYLPNPIDIDKTMQLGNLPVPSLPNNFIVFIGRLSKVKNLKLLLNAFQHIKHQGYELLIVGDGQERSELEDCANNLERSSKIHFIGAVPNSMPYLKRAKVLALPSFSEALPTVLLEALAFSIPIVTTPNAGAVEILQDAKNAFISESFDNVEEFASLLDSAIVHCAEDDRSLLSKYYTLNILPQLERILQS